MAADISNTVEQQAARITQITAHARNNAAGTVDTASAIDQAARGAADVSRNADQAVAGVEKVLAIIIQIREAVVNANTNAHLNQLLGCRTGWHGRSNWGNGWQIQNMIFLEWSADFSI